MSARRNLEPNAQVLKPNRSYAHAKTKTPMAMAGNDGNSRGEGKARGDDLLIVGAGVLGKLVAAQWRKAHPEARIVGETRTDATHDELRSLGIEPRTPPHHEKNAGSEGDGDAAFPFVIFCAPPSGSEDYAGEVARACDRWIGDATSASARGALVFTSSCSVYDVDRGRCDEQSKLKDKQSNERVAKLLKCEEEVLRRGGQVVRLVGLYHSQRGAHSYFLRIQSVPRDGRSVINLIHYEDAADLCVKVLDYNREERDRGAASATSASRDAASVFIGTDGHPVSLQEMMDATLSSGRYTGTCTFTAPVGGDGDGEGKRVDNAATRERLGWTPRHKSFQAFMEMGAIDAFASDAT